jgi:hypothetical protein
MPLFDIAPHRHLHKRIHFQPDFFGVDHGAIVMNDASLFQHTHPPQAG